jgi:hypothetical protein
VGSLGLGTGVGVVSIGAAEEAFFLESLFTEGDKGRREWAIISAWAFYLGPGLILLPN